MMARLNGTQTAWVRRQLLNGVALSHPDLIKACNGRGGWRLGAVIHQLRREGWPIQSRPMPNPGPDTELNPPVCYSVPVGWRPGGRVQHELPI